MTDIQMIDTRETIPGPNDRTIFDQVSLGELAANIKANGLIQPITVRWLDDTKCYQIVAGERRFRACKNILGWTEIPAIVKDLTDAEAASIMLAENVSRDDLDPIDEARAYDSRMSLYGMTASQVAEQAGVTTVRVHFRLKLLKLRPDIQDLVRHDHLSIGYAQTLADANLDTNRQMLAIGKLRDNPRATLGWFRNVVNGLLEQQTQRTFFEAALLSGTQFDAVIHDEPALPPTPSDFIPPSMGNTIKDIIANQSAFWAEAANAWDLLGKPFKRQECSAASKALQLALNSV